MNISELIEKLEYIKKMNGNLDVNVKKVTLAHFQEYKPKTLEYEDKIILDHSADEITTAEADELISL